MNGHYGKIDVVRKRKRNQVADPIRKRIKTNINSQNEGSNSNPTQFFCGWNPANAFTETSVVDSLLKLTKRRLEKAKERRGIESCLRALEIHREGPFWAEARINEAFWLLLHQIHLKLGDKEKSKQVLKEGLSINNTPTLRDALIQINSRDVFLIPPVPTQKSRKIHFSNLNCSISPVKKKDLRRESSDSVKSITQCLSQLDSSVEKRESLGSEKSFQPQQILLNIADTNADFRRKRLRLS